MTQAPTTPVETQLRGAQDRYTPPPGAREILLVRHGSTDGAVMEILEFGDITLTNPPLLPRGHIQAQALCDRLRHQPLSRIFVTPLWRTHQTAAPLAAATGLTPIVIPELREAYLGDWEHEFLVHAAAGHPLVKRMLAEESWDVIPGAESMLSFSTRIRAGIDTIVANTEPDTTCVAFLHAGTIGEICRQATDSRPFGFFAPENTSISRLVINADTTWSLRSFNDVAHLHGVSF